MQIVAPQLTVPLLFDDLQAVPRSKRDAVGRRLFKTRCFTPSISAQGPLLRARLVRIAEREHLLLIATHQVDLRRLVARRARRASCPRCTTPSAAGKVIATCAAPDSICGLCILAATLASHPDIVAQLAYWREQLRDPLPAMSSPHPPEGGQSTISHMARRRGPFGNLSEAFKSFSSQEGGTLFMALVAALKTLLNRYLGQEDVRVATNVANRNRPGTEGLIGPLANIVVLRTNLGGDPNPREVMRRVRATTLAAFAHQDLPYDELANTLERERALKPAALAQVMLLLQNAALRPTASSRQALAFEEADPSLLSPLVTATSYDVILMLHESGDGLVGTCAYKPRLFDPKTIDRLLRDFQTVIEHMVTQPERPISAIQVSLKKKRSN